MLCLAVCVCVFVIVNRKKFENFQFGRNANRHSLDLAERKAKPFDRSSSFRRNRFESGGAGGAGGGSGSGAPKSMAYSSKYPSTAPGGSGGGADPNTNTLRSENQKLRARLQEDAELYQKRLDTYKQAQQNQAALVARLQSKVLQYRKKCNELEDRMCDTIGPPSPKPIKVCPHFKCRISVLIMLAWFHFGHPNWNMSAYHA